MSELTSYLVEYRFKCNANQCSPSDLPETIVSRLKCPLELNPVLDDPSSGVREYVIKATIEAESGARAVEIVHRFFNHLPDFSVVTFAAICLDESRNEKPFTPQDTDLFKAPVQSSETETVSAGASEKPSQWAVDLRFRIPGGQIEPNQFMVNVGWQDKGSCRVDGPDHVIDLRLTFAKEAAPNDAEAENVAWAIVDSKMKLSELHWSKEAATVYAETEETPS